MLKYAFLTSDFFSDYSNCAEIEQKPDRPYVLVMLRVDGVLFGIPTRSHIRHEYAYFTDKENCCGIDYTKAIVITNKEKYIDKGRHPHIRDNEFDALRGKEYQVIQGMKKYIEKYKKAKRRMDIDRNKQLVAFSTLQYFEKYIN